MRPQAIILDIVLQSDLVWAFLAELKADDRTRSIPVLVISTVDDPHKGLGLGADLYAVKPVEGSWLLEQLHQFTRRDGERTILIIEDQEAHRYILKRYLAGTPYRIAEATSAAEGLALARELRPRYFLLDLGLPDMSGDALLPQLKQDVATRDIPVVVVTSRVLSASNNDALREQALAVLSKAELQSQQLLGLLSPFSAAPPLAN